MSQHAHTHTPIQYQLDGMEHGTARATKKVMEEDPLAVMCAERCRENEVGSEGVALLGAAECIWPHIAHCWLIVTRRALHVEQPP